MRAALRRSSPWAVAAALLLAAAWCALSLGTPAVPPARLPGALLGDGAGGDGVARFEALVVQQIRLPRLLLALTAGACLGAAGLVLQEALRNPLAVPEMLGVSSGAAVGVAAPLVLALTLPGWLHPLLAVAGAVAGGVLTLLAAGFGRSPAAVLLTGAAVNAALQSGLLVLMVMADHLDLQLIYRYLLGSFSGLTWQSWAGVWPWLVAAVPLLVLCAPVLAVLRLGDEDAGALGVRVRRARLAALAVAVLLIAPVVAVCGPVAWIGFLAPHLARRLRPGADVVRLLPWTAAWGAVLTVWADQAARLVLMPVETPVGAWTALVGVPAGVALLRTGRRRGRRDRRREDGPWRTRGKRRGSADAGDGPADAGGTAVDSSPAGPGRFPAPAPAPVAASHTDAAGGRGLADGGGAG
ncbi:iron ABC transporter permease [Streptomyces synnematoformans]|uniref:Iron ABC transporter n=1 Tax=Streptomyces synnematoformans TaxID=415721 RepID=A0ABN2XHX6_9ACTN